MKNWTAEHKRTHRLINEMKEVIRIKEKELNLIKSDYKRKIDNIENNIEKLRKNCKHIDDGGPFIATCSVCGWADYYGDC